MVSCKQSTSYRPNQIIDDFQIAPFNEAIRYIESPSEFNNYIIKKGYKVLEKNKSESSIVEEIRFYKGFGPEGEITSNTSCYLYKPNLPGLILSVFDEDVFKELLNTILRDFVFTGYSNPDLRDWYYYIGSLSNGNITIDMYCDDYSYNLAFAQTEYGQIENYNKKHMDISNYCKERSNVLAFKNKYLYKYLKVEGIVYSIEEAGGSEVRIELSNQKIDSGVFYCTMVDYRFKDYLLRIKKGDWVHLCGVVKDLNMFDHPIMTSVSVLPLKLSVDQSEVKSILNDAKVKRSQLIYEKKMKEAGRTDVFIIAKESEPSDFYGHWKTDSKDARFYEVLIKPEYAKITWELNQNVNNQRKEEWESSYGHLYILYHGVLEETYEIDESFSKLRTKDVDGNYTYYYKVK